MKMSDATKMAVALARKGASDDVIALVMETMATHREHIDAARSAAMTASPAALETLDSLVSRSPPTEATKPMLPAVRANPKVRTKRVKQRGDGERWTPLLVSLREIVKQRGPQRGDTRQLAELCPPHFLEEAAIGHSTEYGPMVRGLASMVSQHARSGKTLCGMRFLFLGYEGIRPERGGATAVYRVELA
jgi:hypothetical protein